MLPRINFLRMDLDFHDIGDRSQIVYDKSHSGGNHMVLGHSLAVDKTDPEWRLGNQLHFEEGHCLTHSDRRDGTTAKKLHSLEYTVGTILRFEAKDDIPRVIIGGNVNFANIGEVPKGPALLTHEFFGLKERTAQFKLDQLYDGKWHFVAFRRASGTGQVMIGDCINSPIEVNDCGEDLSSHFRIGIQNGHRGFQGDMAFFTYHSCCLVDEEMWQLHSFAVERCQKAGIDVR